MIESAKDSLPVYILMGSEYCTKYFKIVSSAITELENNSTVIDASSWKRHQYVDTLVSTDYHSRLTGSATAARKEGNRGGNTGDEGAGVDR